MNKKKMVDVMSDMYIAQAMSTTSRDTLILNNKESLFASVLDKHNITQAEFDSSLVWYSDNIKIYLEVSDSVVSRVKDRTGKLRALRRSFEDNVKSYKERGLILPQFYYLSEFNPRLSFFIDSARLKTVKLDQFKLDFDVQGVRTDLDMDATLYFRYKDTLIIDRQNLLDDDHYSFLKPNRPDSLLKSISGYVRIEKNDTIPCLVSVYNISYKDSTLVKVDDISLDGPIAEGKLNN